MCIFNFVCVNCVLIFSSVHLWKYFARKIRIQHIMVFNEKNDAREYVSHIGLVVTEWYVDHKVSILRDPISECKFRDIARVHHFCMKYAQKTLLALNLFWFTVCDRISCVQSCMWNNLDIIVWIKLFIFVVFFAITIHYTRIVSDCINTSWKSRAQTHMCLDSVVFSMNTLHICLCAYFFCLFHCVQLPRVYICKNYLARNIRRQTYLFYK